MTKDERQQSLTNARRACEWLDRYIRTASQINGELKEQVDHLIAGFELLDEKEQKQIRAGKKGKEFGHLGAKHGHKGGRPRKTEGK